MGNPVNIQNLIASIGSVGAEELLSLDPTDKQEGFRELEAWVDGSLDMYRVCVNIEWMFAESFDLSSSQNSDQYSSRYSATFTLILFSTALKTLVWESLGIVFASKEFLALASRFFLTFSSSISPLHSATLHHLSTLLLPAHVQSDELAGRFRNEKYAVRMSRSGFGLLVGWLTEGVGGETLGAGEGFSGEKGKRGRAAVMRVVNNHLRFDGQFSSSFSHSKPLNPSFSYVIQPHYRLSSCMGRIDRPTLVCHSPGKWKQDKPDKSTSVQCK